MASSSCRTPGPFARVAVSERRSVCERGEKHHKPGGMRGKRELAKRKKQLKLSFKCFLQIWPRFYICQVICRWPFMTNPRNVHEFSLDVGVSRVLEFPSAHPKAACIKGWTFLPWQSGNYPRVPTPNVAMVKTIKAQPRTSDLPC